jgi:hypothetical protein
MAGGTSSIRLWRLAVSVMRIASQGLRSSREMVGISIQAATTAASMSAACRARRSRTSPWHSHTVSKARAMILNSPPLALS